MMKDLSIAFTEQIPFGTGTCAPSSGSPVSASTTRPLMMLACKVAVLAEVQESIINKLTN